MSRVTSRSRPQPITRQSDTQAETQTEALPESQDTSQSVKETIVATCVELAEAGYLAGTGGNVAMRISDSLFAVTPSGVDYYSMAADDICVLSLTSLQQLEGRHKASVEAGMHARVLRAKPACSVSVHTHQPVASAYSLLARDLRLYSPEQRRLLGRRIPCVGYAPSGTALLAWRVGRAFQRGIDLCFMRNHGVVCVGTDAGHAVRRVAGLEQACAEYFAAEVAKAPASSTTALVKDAMNSVLKEQK